MQGKQGNACYGQLSQNYSATLPQTATGPWQIKFTVKSVNPFPVLAAGQFFSFTINPPTSGLDDRTNLASDGYTERGIAVIDGTTSTPTGSVITCTVKPLRYTHTTGEVVVMTLTGSWCDIAEQGGILNDPLYSSSMVTWERALAVATRPGAQVNTPIAPAILWMIEDSFGADYADTWQDFRTQMSLKYNGSPAAVGLQNILAQDGVRQWPIACAFSGATPSQINAGIAGYAMVMQNVQETSCTINVGGGTGGRDTLSKSTGFNTSSFLTDSVQAGMIVTLTSGTGSLAANTTVFSVAANTVTLSSISGVTAGTATILFQPQCVSASMLMDGVQFHWLADANGNGAANMLSLQVDGSQVALVDTRNNGYYQYAIPGGAGYHTVSYVNVGTGATGSSTIDSPYFYLNNRTSGVQIWELSHSARELPFFGGGCGGWLQTSSNTISGGYCLAVLTEGSNVLTAFTGTSWPSGLPTNAMVTGDGIPPNSFTNAATGGGSTISIYAGGSGSTVASNATKSITTIVQVHAPAKGLLLGFQNANANVGGYPYLGMVMTVTTNGTTAITCNGTTSDFTRGGVATGHFAVGAPFAPGTTVTVNSNTSITLSHAATASGTFQVAFQRTNGAGLNGGGVTGPPLAPAAIAMCHGTNDVVYNDNTDYAFAYRSALDGIAGWVATYGQLGYYSSSLAAGTALMPSLAVIFPYGTPQGGRVDYSPWELQAMDFCAQNNAAFADLRCIMGDVFSNTSAGSDDPRGYTAGFGTTGLHPSLLTMQAFYTPACMRIFDVGEPNTRYPAECATLTCPTTAWTMVGTERKVAFTSSSGVTVSLGGQQDVANVTQSVSNQAPYLNQSQPLKIGETMEWIQYGTGTVTLSATGTAVLHGTTSTAGQYKGIRALAISATDWLCTPFG